jgi:hypothetical protein
MANRYVRFIPECVAKLFAALRASNNRIEANGPLNQYCALAVDIESMLRGRALKIVLQHIPPESGHQTRRLKCLTKSPSAASQ